MATWTHTPKNVGDRDSGAFPKLCFLDRDKLSSSGANGAHPTYVDKVLSSTRELTRESSSRHTFRVWGCQVCKVYAWTVRGR